MSHLEVIAASPVRQISTIELPATRREPGEAFELWLDVNRPFAAIKTAQRTDDLSIWDYRAHHLHDTVFAFFCNGPIEFLRSRQHVARTGADYVVVQLFTSGSQEFHFEDKSIVAAEGDVVVFDMTVMHAATVETGSSDLSLFIPFGLLDYDPTNAELPRHFRAATPQARLIASNFLAIEPVLPDGGSETAAMFESSLVALLRAMLSRDPPYGLNSASANRTRLDAIRRYIHGNLRSGDLSAARLGDEFGMSRATIYRLFAEHGGVSRYISDCRLSAACRDLQFSPPTRGRIRRTAEKWGYFEQAQFTRAFKRKFGFPPGDALGRMFLPDEAAVTQAKVQSSYHFDWLR